MPMQGMLCLQVCIFPRLISQIFQRTSMQCIKEKLRWSSKVRFNAVHCTVNILQCIVFQGIAVHCILVLFSAVYFSVDVFQYSSVHCIALHCIVLYSIVWSRGAKLQRSGLQRNVLPHTYLPHHPPSFYHHHCHPHHHQHHPHPHHHQHHSHPHHHQHYHHHHRLQSFDSMMVLMTMTMTMMRTTMRRMMTVRMMITITACSRAGLRSAGTGPVLAPPFCSRTNLHCTALNFAHICTFYFLHIPWLSLILHIYLHLVC